MTPTPKIFLGLDLSTAEDRITKVRTGSPRLIERAKLPPWEWDEHKFTAKHLFHLDESEIDYAKRYLAKRVRHGFNYGIAGQKVSDELLKDGYVVDGDECQQLIEVIAELDPEIRSIYQRSLRMQLMSNPRRTLTNTWGAEISFEYNRMDDDLYRRAYSWKPSSECATIMKLWGQIPAWKLFKAHPAWGRINQNGHDSLLMSVLPHVAYDVATYLRANLERAVEYDGVELTIPVEFSLGTNWKFEQEFKRLPNREVFNEIAVGLWERLYNKQYSA